MVLGLISLAATVPMVATSVLNLQSQAENTKSHRIDAEWKTDKCHMRCRPSEGTPDDRNDCSKIVELCFVAKNCYFLPYPDSNFEGLVSTISDEPPQLNWIYLDTGSKSSQISHGLRAEAEEGLTGPWGARVCADGEIRFLMENWEGFIAVELETPGLWGLCSDRYDDGVKGKLGDEQRTVGLKLVREATNAWTVTWSRDLGSTSRWKATACSSCVKSWLRERSKCAAECVTVKARSRVVQLRHLREGAESLNTMGRASNLEAAIAIFTGFKEKRTAMLQSVRMDWSFRRV